MRQALVFCLLIPWTARAEVATAKAAPKTPKGLPQCTSSLKPASDLPRALGETIRYHLDMDGLSVGVIDFKISQRGNYSGKPVTEYRSLFKLDALVATFVPVHGQAAALVPDAAFWPLLAMNRYRLNNSQFEEDVTYQGDGRVVASKRKKDGTAKDETRRFTDPALDFVSAFYMLRTLPPAIDGCTVLYGNQRAYTVWVKADGKDKVKTPAGFRPADRYNVRYGSERGKEIIEGKMWLGEPPARVPYQAELSGKHRLLARIHMYDMGQ
ncbi:MAG: DUF3108 domain-containing protein [Deltaproteobacteria bacterium]|nr:DUF3108 domain-containing protein [Deltaproteobacteria bacterium]